MDLEIGHGAEHIRDWRSKLSQGLQEFFAVGHGTTITGRQAKDRSAFQSGGSSLVDQFVGTLFAELTPERQDFICLGGREENRAAVDGADFVETVLDGSDDTEIAAATTDAPEEILVFGGVCGQEAAIGSDHICANYIIDRESILAMELAPAATESEAGDAYGWDHALRGGETERLGLTVELAELQSSLGANSAFGGIDANAFHCGHVNHETAIANRLTSDAMTAAAYGDDNVVFTSNADAG